MCEKRYVIVRVDGGCPLSDINIGNINACKASKSCQKCLYGDTKEQLIRKVEQVLKKNFSRLFTDESYKSLAKEIIEFMGVEDDK